MFDTSEEADEQQEVLRNKDGTKSLSKSPLDNSKRSFIDISDPDSEAETNEHDVASQSLNETEPRRSVITQRLLFQGEKETRASERLIIYNCVLISNTNRW